MIDDSVHAVRKIKSTTHRTHSDSTASKRHGGVKPPGPASSSTAEGFGHTLEKFIKNKVRREVEKIDTQLATYKSLRCTFAFQTKFLKRSATGHGDFSKLETETLKASAGPGLPNVGLVNTTRKTSRLDAFYAYYHSSIIVCVTVVVSISAIGGPRSVPGRYIMMMES